MSDSANNRPEIPPQRQRPLDADNLVFDQSKPEDSYENLPPGPGGPGRRPPPPPRSYPQRATFQNPRDTSFFLNIGNASFSACLGSLLVYPIVRARHLLDIKPNMSSQERAQRYAVGLKQVVAKEGIKTFLKGYNMYATMIPAITLDLAFFYIIKSVIYSKQYYREPDIPWFGNVFFSGVATTLRYLIYQPISDAYLRVGNYGVKLAPQQVVKEMSRNLQLKAQSGLLYENMAKNLPKLVVFRAVQLGTTETLLQRTKYRDGHTSWIRKFIECYCITACARYAAYPFELARDRVVGNDGNFGKAMKAYTDSLKVTFKELGIRTFQNATGRAFQASGSALALSIFFHIYDPDVPNY